jgi:O-antigen/teichoic acid export membrane protein
MFRFAAEPFVFERAKHANAKETYAFVMKYFVIAMLVIYLGINLYLSGIQYIVGSNYREAMMVVPIISMGYLLYGIYINHSIWYKLNDLTIYAVYITLIGAAITVIINLVLVPTFGYLASAWAHIASYGAMLIMSFIFARKHFKINYNMKGLFPYFIVAVAMVLFSQLYHFKNLLTGLAVSTVLIVAFILFAQFKDKTLTVFLGK